jgi:hypothetical protein
MSINTVINNCTHCRQLLLLAWIVHEMYNKLYRHAQHIHPDQIGSIKSISTSPPTSLRTPLLHPHMADKAKGPPVHPEPSHNFQALKVTGVAVP